MALSWRGLSYADRSADEGISLVGTWGWNNSRVARAYDVVLTDYAANGAYSHQNVVRFLLGWPEVVQGSTTKYLRRNIPHYLNYLNTDTGKPYLFATKAETRPVAPSTKENDGGPNSAPVYKQVRVNVDYESLPFRILEDGDVTTRLNGDPDESGWERYITKIVRPSGQFFTVNSGPDSSGYYYVSDSSVVRIGVSKLLSFCNLQVTWHQVPERAVPSVFVNPRLSAYSAIENCIGKVNHATFNSYLKGTLLLLGAEIKPYNSPFGQRVYDIVYMFKFFAPTATTGHQYLFKPSSADWLEVTTQMGTSNLVTQANGKSIYDWAKDSGSQFADLFRPPA